MPFTCSYAVTGKNRGEAAVGVVLCDRVPERRDPRIERRAARLGLVVGLRERAGIDSLAGVGDRGHRSIRVAVSAAEPASCESAFADDAAEGGGSGETAASKPVGAGGSPPWQATSATRM